MRAIADFIMRGRMQATLVVVGSAAVPLLFWLSAAASSLVLLRRGPRDAIGILAWALLPALAWWYYGEPRTLLVLVGSLALALMLRAGHAWAKVVLFSIPLGVVYGVVLGTALSEPINELATALNQQLPQMLGDVYQQMSVDEQGRLAALIAPVLTGLMAALLQLASLLSLILGRYWQAALYNPGGFGREFRALRLPPVVALGLLAVMLLAPNLGLELALLTPLCSVPLALAGVALVHGLAAEGRLAKFWLVGLYVSMLLFMQLIYPLLVAMAIVDSLIDFRGRRAPKNGSDTTNGEG